MWGKGENTAYIMGPDLADYALISSGGRLGDMCKSLACHFLRNYGSTFQLQAIDQVTPLSDSTCLAHMDVALGDGGQSLIKEGADFDTTIKRRWLFDLELDPTERTDLSAEYPAKVAELLGEIEAERQHMVPPLLLQAGPETAIARTEVQPAPVRPGGDMLQLQC